MTVAPIFIPPSGCQGDRAERRAAFQQHGIDFSHFETLDDVQCALRECEKEEAKVVEHLKLMSQQPIPSSDAFKEAHRTALEDLVEKGDALTRKTEEGGGLALTMLDPLSSLDSELSSLDKAIERIDLLVDIKGCIANVKTAMNEQDWETAAGYVHRHLERTAQQENILKQQLQATQTEIIPPLSPEAKASAFARHLSSPLDLPPSLQSLFPHESAIENDMKNAEGILLETRLALKESIQKEFTRAANMVCNQTPPAPNDQQALIRCFKLFPRIGEKEMGMSMFSNYVASQLARRWAEAFKGFDQYDAGACIHLLTKLFENIAFLMDQNANMIEETYGPGHILRLIQRLYQESLTQGGVLLDGWMEKRRLKQILSVVRKNGEVSARELDAVLSEQVVIIQRCYYYHRFVHHRARAQMISAKAQLKADGFHDDALSSMVNHAIENRHLSSEHGLPLLSALEESVKSLANDYMTLEEYYIKTNMEHAMQLDQPLGDLPAATKSPTSPSFTSQCPLISSCVDDVFYLLKKCVLRAIGTHDLDVTCALLQTFELLLCEIFASALQARVSELLELFSTDPTAEIRSSMMMYINDLQQTVSYMPKFLDETERNAQVLFESAPAQPGEEAGSQSYSPREIQVAKQKEKLSFCLAPFNQLSHTISHDVQGTLERIFQTFLKSQVMALLKHLHTSYAVSEDDYMQMSANNQFIGSNFKFTSVFSKLLANTRNELAGASLNVLLLIMVDYWVSEWQRMVMSQRFTQYGALYLERDVRSFSAYVTSQASTDRDESDTGSGAANSLNWSHSLREKLAPMHQILTLLNLSSPSEVHDYWGPAAIAQVPWKLTSQQVRAVLSLRIEFNNEEIQKLRL